jgi:hypothetical protein
VNNGNHSRREIADALGCVLTGAVVLFLIGLCLLIEYGDALKTWLELNL